MVDHQRDPYSAWGPAKTTVPGAGAVTVIPAPRADVEPAVMLAEPSAHGDCADRIPEVDRPSDRPARRQRGQHPAGLAHEPFEQAQALALLGDDLRQPPQLAEERGLRAGAVAGGLGEPQRGPAGARCAHRRRI